MTLQEFIDKISEGAWSVQKTLKAGDDWDPQGIFYFAEDGSISVRDLSVYMDNQMTKHLLSSVLALSALSEKPTYMGFLLSTWAVEGPKVSKDASEEEKEAVLAEMMEKHPVPSKSPDRFESIQIIAFDGETILMKGAKILRSDENPPGLDGWSQSESPEMGGMFELAFRSLKRNRQEKEEDGKEQP